MIKLENVTKVYKTGVRALNDVSLDIAPGEFVYVIGPTGAGKSTFIKLLYREEVATSGKVFVDGQDVKKIKNWKVPYFRRKIGVVFQNYRLLPKKTVFENIAFALEVTDTPKVEIRKKVRRVLELVGLEDNQVGSSSVLPLQELLSIIQKCLLPMNQQVTLTLIHQRKLLNCLKKLMK